MKDLIDMTLKRLLGAALPALFLTITGCMPPPATPVSSNLTLEMRRMQATIATQEQAISTLAERLDSLAAQQDRQQETLLELQQERATAPTSGRESRWATVPAQGSPAAMGDIDQGSPTEVYLEAFGNYASGRYPVAIEGFRNFLERFPNNSYASNAQFWLGDCYFNQQQYELAIGNFQKVLDEHARAPKSPDALLKIATAQVRLGRPEEARQTVDTLINRYPESTAAQKAEELALP